MIELDGSMLEGGGQLVRTAVALAALMGKEIHIRNVRAKRSPPGFQPQHLTGVKAVATLSEAETMGLEIGSTELLFKPKTRLSGSFAFNIGTAGSIPLVLQALMPVAPFSPAPVTLRLIGGTNVRWSPPIDYLSLVLLPTLSKMGYRGKISVQRRGHYPKGGGEILAEITPIHKLYPFRAIEFGEVVRIRGISYCVKLPRHVAERQANSAIRTLQKEGYMNIEIETEWYDPTKDPHLGPGSGITLYAEISTGTLIGSDSMGERGKPAEKVGEEAAIKLIEELKSEAPIDHHLGDMLIPYVAIADGKSEFKVSKLTLHTMTGIAIAESIVNVKFEVKGELGSPSYISTDGIGLVNEAL